MTNKLSAEQMAEEFINKHIERFSDKVLDQDENADGDLQPFLNRRWFKEVLQETYLSSHAAACKSHEGTAEYRLGFVRGKAEAMRWIPTSNAPTTKGLYFVMERECEPWDSSGRYAPGVSEWNGSGWDRPNIVGYIGPISDFLPTAPKEVK